MENKDNVLQIFDNHCHVRFIQPIDETLEGFEKEAKELGISRYAILACPSLGNDKEPMILENLKCFYLKDRMSIPTYMYAGFTWHYDDEASYVEFAKTMLEIGADGFKTLEQHPRIRKNVGKGLCHPTFNAFFEYVGRQGVPMVCHVGDPRFNWNMETASEAAKLLGRVYDESYLCLDALYGEMEAVFRKHPEVKIILAHFYFKSDDYDGLTKRMEQYPNLYLDLTPGAEMFVDFSKDIEKWRKFFLRYSKRIIMGSDLYGNGLGVNRHRLVRRYLETSESFLEPELNEVLCPMNLSEDILRDIYSNNAIRVSSSTPKPINRAKAYELCKKMEKECWDRLDNIEQHNLKTMLKFWEK